MLLPERRLAIAFNGEIYNYQELRADLERRGHQFRSPCDTEVLLRLYAEEGEAMLPKLQRHVRFRVYCWDGAEESIFFLARDSFGIKPLYWADDGKTFRAASQVKALAGRRADPRRSRRAMSAFLWGDVPEPYTLHRGVRTPRRPLPHPLDAAAANALRKFCSVPDLLAEVEAALHPGPWRGPAPREPWAPWRPVRHHLIADVPVGIFFPGLDSSDPGGPRLGMRRPVAHRHPRFQEFQGTVNDEAPLAEQMARH